MRIYRRSGDWTARRDWRSARPGAWRPLEVAAMVAGFALYWPLGIAVLLTKFWQKREGYAGDLFGFARDKAMAGIPGGWQTAARGAWTAPWQFGGFGNRSSGNSAFDAWRAGELDRLEAERRKLVDAEREFGEHLDRLRRARDREEFDRFMAERRTRDAGSSTTV